MEIDWSTFSGQLPIFPLPNIVQFPHTVLPLHIFEKRYRIMLKNAMQGEKLIGMTVLKPGWEESYSGNPPIYPFACLGRIVKHESMPDGRSNILLYGLKRTRIVDIVSPRPYRTALVEVVQDTISGLTTKQMSAFKKKLLNLYGEFVIEFADSGQNYPTLSDAELELGHLTDAIAATIGLPTEQQIHLLGEFRVGMRAKYLIERLEGKLNKPAPTPTHPTHPTQSGVILPRFPNINLN